MQLYLSRYVKLLTWTQLFSCLLLLHVDFKISSIRTIGLSPLTKGHKAPNWSSWGWNPNQCEWSYTCFHVAGIYLGVNLESYLLCFKNTLQIAKIQVQRTTTKLNKVMCVFTCATLLFFTALSAYIGRHDNISNNLQKHWGKNFISFWYWYR